MSWLQRLSQFVEKSGDDIVAILFAIGGLYYALTHDIKDGLAIAGVGTSYLFGKSRPKG